jgi:hypothetical protein
LADTALAVEPGSQASAEVRVRNTGTVVDQFTFEVLGEAGPWSTVEPPSLSLFPGAEGTARVQFAPPRLATTPSGPVPFALRADSKEDPEGSQVEEGTVTVSPFSEVIAELIPRTSHGSRHGKHDLAIDNRGNAQQRVALSATDPDALLIFDIRPPELVAAAGTAGFAKVRARARRPFLRGAAQTRPFQVKLEPDQGDPILVDGAMLQDPVIPSWAPRALAVLVALLVAAVINWFAVVKPQIKSSAKQQVAQQLAATGAAPGGGAAGAGKAGGGGAGSGKGGAGAGANGGAGSATAAGGQSTPPTTGPTAPGAPGPSIDGRLNPVQGSFTVPNGKLLELTDVVLENPDGAQGTMTLQRSGRALLVVNLANFRDLDYHFVSPITVGAGQQLQLVVTCCAGAASPSIYFTGYLPNAPTA